MASALETLEPWLEQRLPNLESVAQHHFVHLVTGTIEQQLQGARKCRRIPTMSSLTVPPVFDYQRRFPSFSLTTDAAWIELR